MTLNNTHADWWKQAVVYQIYPRSFKDVNGDGLGDIAGVADRIPYLKELGVDAIWLSPFYPSELADGGYDVIDYRDVDPRLGAMGDFDAMAAAAHEAGMKVIVSILGNHDQAGVAQLSDWGAREFARELAAYCDAYNLDGVTFDDEYSSSPDLDNPWLTSRSYAAAARLVYECKRAMPDKIVSVFSYEHMNTSGFMSIDGTEPGDYIDYAVGDYSAWGDYFTYFYHETLDKKQCSGMSIELNLGRGDSSESTARSRKEEGYGYYMFFALNPNQYSSRVSRCQNVCRGLYDEELVYPSYYYPKNSTVRTFLN